jgi:hypothetical protein
VSDRNRRAAAKAARAQAVVCRPAATIFRRAAHNDKVSSNPPTPAKKTCDEDLWRKSSGARLT